MLKVKCTVYVCDKTFRLKVSQQSTVLPKGQMPAVKVADVITATEVSVH
jgi:hypothetical protein